MTNNPWNLHKTITIGSPTSKEIGTRVVYEDGFSTSQMPTPGTSICWIYEMTTSNVTGRVVISWVEGGNTES